MTYQIGKTYKMVNGGLATISGYANKDDTAGYETVYCTNNIHRYSQRDFGRVTGTDHNVPDNRNLLYPPQEG